MSLDDRLVAVLDRIAPASSVMRVRAREAELSEHQGSGGALRLEATIRRLEMVADDLERAIR